MKPRPDGLKALLIFLGGLLLPGCNTQLSNSGPDPLPAEVQVTPTIDPPSILGVCWTAGDTLDASCLEPVHSKGVNYLSQTPFGYQPEHNNPLIQTYPDERMGWGESRRGMIHTSKLARDKGIKTMMKPHLWMPVGKGKWRSDIAMDSEEAWQQWFTNYGEFILYYATIAEAGGMESLCIGTELHQTAKQRPDNWRALIREIRKVYHGELTYAANFYEEYEDVTFWDDLDFIGIQGYFPLTGSENPTLEELLEGWKSHVAAIEELSKKYNKPVVFTEIGYKSTKDAAITPWEWPDGRNATYNDTSNLTQARCYEAMFQTFQDKEWCDGLFIWKWHPEKFATPPEVEKARLKRVADWKAKSPQTGFSPQGKLAEQVMIKWFKAWQKERP